MTQDNEENQQLEKTVDDLVKKCHGFKIVAKLPRRE